MRIVRLPHIQRPSAMTYLMFFLGTVALSSTLLLELEYYVGSKLTTGQYLGCWVGMTLFLFGYVLGAWHDQRKRHRRQIDYEMDFECVFLTSEKRVDEVSYLFNENHPDPQTGKIQIKLLTRLGRAFLVLPIILVTATGIAAWYVLARGHALHYWIVLLELWAFAYIIAWQWWSSWLYGVSRDFAVVARVYGPWLWWFPDMRRRLLLKDCSAINLLRPWWARLTGTGVLQADSAALIDKRFNNLWGLPYEEESERITREAIKDANYRVTVDTHSSLYTPPSSHTSTQPIPRVQSTQPNKSRWTPPTYKPY